MSNIQVPNTKSLPAALPKPEPVSLPQRDTEAPEQVDPTKCARWVYQAPSELRLSQRSQRPREVPTISLLKESDVLAAGPQPGEAGWLYGQEQSSPRPVMALGTLQGRHSQVCFQNLPPVPNKAHSSLVTAGPLLW